MSTAKSVSQKAADSRAHLPKGSESEVLECSCEQGECSSMDSGLLLVRSMAVHMALWILAPPSGRSSMYMLAACSGGYSGEPEVYITGRHVAPLPIDCLLLMC